MNARTRYQKLDQKARYKRLMHVFNYPEDATSEAELRRAEQYARWLTGEMRDAIDTVDDLLADDDLWDTLAEQRDRMDKALDELRDAIAEAEDALVKRYKGRCAAVELTENWALLFWHTGGKWGLYTLNHKSGMNGLAHAPKEVRLLAVAALDDLWHQLQYEDE